MRFYVLYSTLITDVVIIASPSRHSTHVDVRNVVILVDYLFNIKSCQYAAVQYK